MFGRGAGSGMKASGLKMKDVEMQTAHVDSSWQEFAIENRVITGKDGGIKEWASVYLPWVILEPV